MRTIFKTAVGTAAVAAGLLLAAPALYAHDVRDSSQCPMVGSTMMHGGPMMGGMMGMMGHMNRMMGGMLGYMGQMSQMISACDEMMKGAARQNLLEPQQPGQAPENEG